MLNILTISDRMRGMILTEARPISSHLSVMVFWTESRLLLVFIRILPLSVTYCVVFSRHTPARNRTHMILGLCNLLSIFHAIYVMNFISYLYLTFVSMFLWYTRYPMRKNVNIIKKTFAVILLDLESRRVPGSISVVRITRLWQEQIKDCFPSRLERKRDPMPEKAATLHPERYAGPRWRAPLPLRATDMTAGCGRRWEAHSRRNV